MFFNNWRGGSWSHGSGLSSPSSLSTLHPFGQLPPQPFSRRCFCEFMGPGKVTQCGSLMMVPLSYDSVCK